jgi:hypothetical protein
VDLIAEMTETDVAEVLSSLAEFQSLVADVMEPSPPLIDQKDLRGTTAVTGAFPLMTVVVRINLAEIATRTDLADRTTVVGEIEPVIGMVDLDDTTQLAGETESLTSLPGCVGFVHRMTFGAAIEALLIVWGNRMKRMTLDHATEEKAFGDRKTSTGVIEVETALIDWVRRRNRMALADVSETSTSSLSVGC